VPKPFIWQRALEPYFSLLISNRQDGIQKNNVEEKTQEEEKKKNPKLTGYLNSVEDSQDHLNSAQNPSALISITSPAWVNSTVCAYKSSN